ncbi:MAG: YggS family pyridoxal phosphate-dependent enzyme [Anaerolineaceae bacterium]|nr:YggS family pyridoxal phosphate-dependent enzyme [Anaerolineaceae bacterium]
MVDDQTRKIKNNLERVQERMTAAALLAGRGDSHIRLVVVTKAQNAEVLRAAVEAGASILGENYADESVQKIMTLQGKLGVEWHMIGHVQSRKVKQVVENFDMVHSLDSLKLARKYNQYLVGKNRRIPVLLEFNLGGEPGKSGWQVNVDADLDQLFPELEQLISLPTLEFQGLMTMPPLFEDSRRTIPYFRKLRMIRDRLSRRFPGGSWAELSMGTSADFEEAILEGATMVRIGQAILGSRPK